MDNMLERYLMLYDALLVLVKRKNPQANSCFVYDMEMIRCRLCNQELIIFDLKERIKHLANHLKEHNLIAFV